MQSFLESRIVIIVIKEKERALRHLYQTRAKARIISEIEEVQKQMNADMEATKEQMTTMMEAKMSIRKMMEVNTTTIIVTSTATKVDPTNPFGLNQVNHPVLDMVGQGGKALESTSDPHFVQVQGKHSFPPYGLPPNYTPPNVAHALDENVDNSAPIPIKRQQPQSDHAQVPQPMGETHEADFEPHLVYAIEGQTFCGVPLPNTLGGPHYFPQPQPLHFAVGRLSPTIV